MNFFKYLRDQGAQICFYIFGLILLDLILWLDPYHDIAWGTLLYLNIVLTCFYIFFLCGHYLFRANWFHALKSRKNAHLQGLNWPLDEANSHEERLVQSYVNSLLNYHQKQLDGLLSTQQDQREFIDRWVHDIKVPLAGVKLIIETNEEQLSDRTYNQLETELQKMNFYVEQVLYYSRLDDFANDYLIQSYPLKPIIREVVKQNMHYFIDRHLQLTITGTDETVLTDQKWLIFILNQVLSNSLNYTPDNGQITFNLSHSKTGIDLTLHDTGIGIPKEDLPRIFEKGFTGSNGRNQNQHATGLGLYLAKQLATKLGHELSAMSVENNGTTITLHFPFLSYYNEKPDELLR